MENDIIVKRFLFDIEMGKFNIEDGYTDCITMDCNDKEKLKKLEKVLLNAGYRQYEHYSVDEIFVNNIMGTNGVGFDFSTKEYWCYNFIESKYQDCDNSNEIPDYIDDYKI